MEEGDGEPPGLVPTARRAPAARAARLPGPEERAQSAALLGRSRAAPDVFDAASTHRYEQLAGLLAALARRNGGARTVEELLACRDPDGHTPLHLCMLAPLRATKGEGGAGGFHDAALTVSALLDARADANAANSRGETALLLLVREHGGTAVAGHGHRGGLRRLLGALRAGGADFDLGDTAGITALHEAAELPDPLLAELLIDLGADAFLTGGPRHRTAFEVLQAKWPGDAQLLQRCAASGSGDAAAPATAPPSPRVAGTAQAAAARAHCFDQMRQAARDHRAAELRRVIGSWIADGRPPSELLGFRDADGNGWLHMLLLSPIAGDTGDAMCLAAQALLEANAAPDASNAAGETPLLLAVSEAPCEGGVRYRLIRSLLDARASPGPRAGVAGRARGPLEEAARLGDKEAVGILLAENPDVLAAAKAAAAAAAVAMGPPATAAPPRQPAAREPWLGGGGRQWGGAPPESTSQPRRWAQDLAEAMARHDVRAVRALLSVGSADEVWGTLRGRGEDDQTPLHHFLRSPPPSALAFGDFGGSGDGERRAAVVRLLVDAAADANAAGRRGETPLLTAVREAALLDNPAAVVQALLDVRAHADGADHDGRTPLMEACRAECVELVELLLAVGASPEARDACGRSASDAAAPGGGAAAALRRFSQPAAGPASGTRGGGGDARRLSFAEAVRCHDAELVAKLLEEWTAAGKSLGPLLNAQDADGHSPLHLCVLAADAAGALPRFAETAKVLLAARAAPNLVNSQGESALLLVARELGGSAAAARLDVARQLMRAGADKDLADAADATPLEEAARLGDAQLCQLLLDRGADVGVAAREVAMRRPELRALFEAHAGRGPAGQSAAEGEQEAEQCPQVEVRLRHMVTGLERMVEVEGGALMRDIKRMIVRKAKRGSWRRVALLSEDGRLLGDDDALDGRSTLLMADARSPEVRLAAERAALEALSEEVRWSRMQVGELQAEAERRGIFAGTDRECILESLRQVKAWEGSSSKDLLAQCTERSLVIDANPDRDDLLAQLKQDLSWESMPEESLLVECGSRGIPPPTIDAGTDSGRVARALRQRLRQASRFEKLPLESVRKACESRNYETQGRTRQEMLAFLKSFRALPKQAAEPPPPAPKPSPPKAAARPGPVFNQGGGGGGRGASGPGNGFLDEDEDGERFPAGLSERVRNVCRKYPNFCGEYLLEMNSWSNEDIDMYLYSNGFLKPRPRKKVPAPKVPLRSHYEALGLPDGSPASDVRRAYLRLVLIYHPDKNPEDPETAAERFRRISDAYEAITARMADECDGAAG